MPCSPTTSCAAQRALDALERDRQYEAFYAACLKNNRRLAQAHAELALWCEEKGLAPEATAHFSVAIHFDPYRESTWKRLGYLKRDGRWITRDQAAIADQDQREQKRADKDWEPTLKKWSSLLADKRGRTNLEKLLATVTDRRALPSVLKVFLATGPEDVQLCRVRLLGQIDDPASSRALAAQAIQSGFGSVRRQAIEILKGRPPRDYAGDLVEMIHGPMRYEVKPVSAHDSPGALAINAPRFRMLRTYEVPPAFELDDESFKGYISYSDNGLPIVVTNRDRTEMYMMSGTPGFVANRFREIEVRTGAMLFMANEVARDRMAADIRMIESANRQAELANARIIPVLESTARRTAGSWRRRRGLARLVVRQARLQLSGIAQADVHPGYYT